MELRTKGIQGSVFKTAKVFSNDPKRPQLMIGIKGRILVPIDLRPKYAHLKGVLGEGIEAVVHLRSQKKEPLIVRFASVSIPDKVAVELKEVEEGRSYELKVRNKAEEGGRYIGQIKLTTNYPEKPELIVRIVGRVRPSVEVIPKRLSFGRMSEQRLEHFKKHKRLIRRAIMIGSNKGKDLKVERVELEKSLFRVFTREKQPGQRVELLVEPILEKLRKGPNEDCLKIYTNQKECKILEVPITLLILDKDEDDDYEDYDDDDYEDEEENYMDEDEDMDEDEENQ